ncbi:N5-glutamine S-adenosyl-L-methionine-dependent methyltransferase [Acinetobacter baumannii]|nr:N5-glutamine S-adenosyl-L-methionine-dependent methyltransferase [Acinetobacter baumannii]SSS49500.1 N5-glutamine S-adenosyl-L-methionine-dependent methyltransferase [Acinetobacter baumannii]SSU68319.1 N5-glutamine S-adenosyl-L-methionine-dependent methyltransferase [Acinetobacter baumannii]
MRQNFNTVDFNWLTFQKGGSGIFALTAEQCRRYRKLFEEQV